MNATDTFAQTERTRVRRLPQRASYDVETVHGILDAGLVCHVGFVEDGRPVVIPTAYARVGDTVVLHGSSKSRTLLAAAGGADVRHRHAPSTASCWRARRSTTPSTIAPYAPSDVPTS